MKLEYFTIICLPVSFILLALSGYQDDYYAWFLIGFVSTFGVGLVSALRLIDQYSKKPKVEQ